MSTLEIYFWLLLPVYLVGALTIANWLASWTDYYVRLYKAKYYVRLYKAKKVREKDNI